MFGMDSFSTLVALVFAIVFGTIIATNLIDAVTAVRKTRWEARKAQSEAISRASASHDPLDRDEKGLPL